MNYRVGSRLLAALLPLALGACGKPAAPPVSPTPAPTAPPAPPAPASGAKVGSLLAGTLEPEKVAAFLYGGGDAAALPAWRPATLWKEDGPSFDETTEFECKTVGVMPFTEKGARRAFVLTSANTPSNDCHSCAALVGAAAFTETPAGWRLDAVNLEVEPLGENGVAPDGELVALGPERHGILLKPSFSNMGETEGALVWLAERGTSFADVLTVEKAEEDNTGACEDDEGNHGCWAWDSTWELVPTGRELSDVRLKIEGTRRESDGRVGPYDETRLYVWDGTKYEKRR